MASNPPELPADLLRSVSRSFYLTVRVLPRSIRGPIGLAYLLARASDTITDTELIPPAERIKALRRFQNGLMSGNAEKLHLTAFLFQQGSPAERRLLERLPELWDMLAVLSPADQELIREVLGRITSGQELDLLRFPNTGTKSLTALESDEELEDYTYRVAGCVGEFWTKMCFAHLFQPEAEVRAALLNDAIRFGKGLQLVNVLRDLATDLRTGRCYLPKEKLREFGLTPQDLLDRGNEARFRPCFMSYLEEAEAHLAAGWEYTNRLPITQIRVRLACAWPILIGMQTIVQLRAHSILDPARRIKISRAQVRRILFRSTLLYPWSRRWRQLFEWARAAF
jgi:farnesyl-diphosphate farnesyltransferase